MSLLQGYNMCRLRFVVVSWLPITLINIYLSWQPPFDGEVAHNMTQLFSKSPCRVPSLYCLVGGRGGKVEGLKRWEVPSYSLNFQVLAAFTNTLSTLVVERLCKKMQYEF